MKEKIPKIKLNLPCTHCKKEIFIKEGLAICNNLPYHSKCLIEQGKEEILKLITQELDSLECFLCADFGQKDWSIRFLHKHFDIMRKRSGLEKYDFNRYIKNLNKKSVNKDGQDRQIK